MNLADSIPSDECFTIEALAEQIQMGVPRTRQIVAKVKQEKLIPWLVKREGKALLYTPEFAKKFVELYEAGRFGKPRNKLVARQKVREKHAKLLVTVPIYDEQEAKILEKKFGNSEEIMKFLVVKLQEVTKPGLKKITELKEKQRKEMEELERSLAMI